MSTAVHWHVDDIDDALAADFDGSLSGLGMELNTSSFNMSETLLALPTLKNEHNRHHVDDKHANGNNSDNNSHHSSPHHNNHIVSHNLKGSNSELSSLSLPLNHSIQEDGRPEVNGHRKKNRLAYGQDEESVSSTIKRFCFSNERETCNSDSVRYIFATHGLIPRGSEAECNHEDCSSDMKCQNRHSNSAPDLRTTSTPSGLPTSGRSSPSPVNNSSVLNQILGAPYNDSFGSIISHESKSPETMDRNTNEFQYLLGAATSMATKVNEETMTYLNQGQPYEIKIKKLGDLTEWRGKMLRSIIRIGFHERRLQYMEKDLIMQWKQCRQSERILEIDVPLSYGIYQNLYDSQEINKCEFIWDPTKETGVFVKVNCISTEFTPKKHGGEKGVPFRLIIETHSYNGNNSKNGASTIIHAASCQIKVFKPKGADRKHKTDREKMSKRPQSEQEKFKPSYDTTSFTKYPLDSLYTTYRTATTGTASVRSSPPSSPPNSVPPNVPSIEEKAIPESQPYRKGSIPEQREIDPLLNYSLPSIVGDSILTSDATSGETMNWLIQNRFDAHVRTFTNFAGSDLLKLNRNDLIQICGLTDGIRLFNALHIRSVKPKMTIYVCNPLDDVFRALYLENLDVSELKNKLAAVILCSTDCFISRIFLQGPSGIKVLMTDEVVRNFSADAIFLVQFDRDGPDEKSYEATLKPYK
ncbi:transcription factor CP2 like gemini isoform X2 [Brevipalpus obovatus]|uniref:transcription factor CP2 like gemini isoform X2 n=1 Tax=Brevipalpus obovatus TaxID=246614 RepID=UPI003D9F87DB